MLNVFYDYSLEHNYREMCFLLLEISENSLENTLLKWLQAIILWVFWTLCINPTVLYNLTKEDDAYQLTSILRNRFTVIITSCDPCGDLLSGVNWNFSWSIYKY